MLLIAAAVRKPSLILDSLTRLDHVAFEQSSPFQCVYCACMFQWFALIHDLPNEARPIMVPCQSKHFTARTMCTLAYQN